MTVKIFQNDKFIGGDILRLTEEILEFYIWIKSRTWTPSLLLQLLLFCSITFLHLYQLILSPSSMSKILLLHHFVIIYEKGFWDVVLKNILSFGRGIKLSYKYYFFIIAVSFWHTNSIFFFCQPLISPSFPCDNSISIPFLYLPTSTFWIWFKK